MMLYGIFPLALNIGPLAAKGWSKRIQNVLVGWIVAIDGNGGTCGARDLLCQLMGIQPILGR